MKRTLAVLALASFAATNLYAKAVEGASVQSVTVDGRTASISVRNQSGKDITGYTIALTARFADGRVEASEFTQDGTLLHPQQVAVETEPYSAPPLTVEANVIVAVYSDGTAEAERQEALDTIIAVRTKHAKTAKLLAGILQSALSGSSPSEAARGKLESVMASAQKDKTLDAGDLQMAYQNILRAPQGKEREALEQQVSHYSKEAAASASHAQIRRLQ